MRLWSLHPKYLDARGLVALWREALLAQAVLRGETRGYRQHPQLVRFLDCPAPVSAISAYLAEVHAEAGRRGYSFDRSRIARVRATVALTVTQGQLDYEWQHLLSKLAIRDAGRYAQLRTVVALECHPLFRPCAGPVQPWEKTRPAGARTSRTGRGAGD